MFLAERARRLGVGIDIGVSFMTAAWAGSDVHRHGVLHVCMDGH